MAGDDKARFLRDAEKLVTHGKIPQAINEYLKILKADPNDVLTLNTVGDLYLRLGKVPEATKYFSQVADTYTRNNFLLKAIAVYKKILRADAGNLPINQTLAELLARQGLHVDARNQYLRLAEVYSNEGKKRESVQAYEKAAELDPANSDVQLKLAQIYLSEGNKERARSFFTGAARAQAKAGKHKDAVSSYQQAMQLDPLDAAALKGFLDASDRLGDVTPVLEQLKKSLKIAPDNVALLELLAQAYIASGDLEGALKAFQTVVSQDESRFPLIFTVSSAYVAAGDYDRACLCLDSLVQRSPQGQSGPSARTDQAGRDLLGHERSASTPWNPGETGRCVPEVEQARRGAREGRGHAAIEPRKRKVFETARAGFH